MPKVTIYFIRSGMIFFVLSLGIAVFMELPGTIGTGMVLALRPVFWHFLLVGWITQIIMGVSFWMFPRKRRGEAGGGEKIAWYAFSCINIGLILRAFTEPFVSTSAPVGYLEIMLVISAILQVIGGVAYVFGIWPRVKGKRKRRGR